jgi:hypothetical protein
MKLCCAVLTVILSPRGRTRRFLPLRDVWRVSREVGAASTEAAEQSARKVWIKRMVGGQLIFLRD